MIFSPALVHKIISGTKTQTRRRVRPGDTQCRYEVGKSYAIQAGRGKKQVARLIVTDVRQEPVGHLTFEDARREGFRTRADFARYWLHLYSKTYDPEMGDAEVLSYFGSHFGASPVWVISFHLDREEPLRFLHRRSEYGYTSMSHEAMQDDELLEAVDDATLKKFAADAIKREAELREDATVTERRALAAQIDALETALAERSDLGVSRDIRVLRATLRKIDKKLKAA